jgi:hypothetical protein
METETKVVLERHEEQIKTLFKQNESINKRVDDMNDIKTMYYNLDKSMALQTQLLESVVEHNKKQDARMDERQEIDIKINENLTELAEGQRTLNKRVGKLEERVDENDCKHLIDLRDIKKKKYTDIIFKYIIPSGGALLLLQRLLELLKG